MLALLFQYKVFESCCCPLTAPIFQGLAAAGSSGCHVGQHRSRGCSGGPMNSLKLSAECTCGHFLSSGPTALTVSRGYIVPKQGAEANERMYYTDRKLLGSGPLQGPREGTCRKSLPKAHLPWKIPPSFPLCLCRLGSCSVPISCLDILFYPSDVASSNQDLCAQLI